MLNTLHVVLKLLSARDGDESVAEEVDIVAGQLRGDVALRQPRVVAFHKPWEMPAAACPLDKLAKVFFRSESNTALL